MLLKFLVVLFFLSFTSSVKILHLSDIHYDHGYTINSPTQCEGGIIGLRCCHVDSIPLANTSRANKWGDFNCDTPALLLKESIAWIKNNLNIDGVFYTGDTVSHHDLQQILDWNDNYQDIVYVTTLLSTLNVPVYSVLGNHDSTPFVDQLWGPFPVLSSVANLWQDNALTNGANISNFSTGGYYAAFAHNLQTNIVGMNCLLYDTNNLMVMTNTSYDWGKQFEWVRNISNPFILLSHIPPRSGEGSALFNKFVTQINPLLEFYGHTHEVAYQIVYREIPHVALVASSLQPDQHFPMFSLYDVDLWGNLSSFKIYYLNLTQQQQMSDDAFIGYELLVDFAQFFDMPNLSTNSFMALTKRMALNDTLFEMYCGLLRFPFRKECSDKQAVLCNIDQYYC